ncbi:cobalt-precorrin-5B (C1)-methyltransferase [Pseudobutyrivibrio sp. YE44]|uniref:cobalt-precorrin-5B (C(1))-methyltransferase CbiD n=1 Tax=Pseudobutyrivibrio sp. YE44 TaxID=1520802 RepID=UPI0008875EA4|nr:cobalt-precorrin-5B (C(1))-methyltransferase CbiD [Pseudobutyrivibrio sp. YE44]SDB05864.1 cobalt-precorrin-5B (C1)-methyltransferase [Pseudobutyrivibrio sp. YE44]
MKKGFTTGSCSAAAAKAAAYMLLSGKEKNQIEIETPAGVMFKAELVDIVRDEGSVSCAVIKDGGDDPDVTTGAHVKATVTVRAEGEEDAFLEPVIEIDGGKGVGRVTLPGLDQPVGNAAINSVPRSMIEKEVLEVCHLLDFKGKLLVEISVPEGEKIAEHTFNPRLGITGGISILGTTGIVEPMSNKALVDTIRVELNQKKSLGNNIAFVSPGNYGLKFMKEQFDYDLDKSVKCSNFIGETVDMACELGFETMVLTGHIGKLVKVAGGIMNTHSHEADARMEILSSCALRAGADADIARAVLECLNTEEALRMIKEKGLLEETMKIVLEKIIFYLNFRAQGRIKFECVLYSNEFGILAETEGAGEAFKRS